MDFDTLIRTRESCKKYSSRTVERDDLDAILEAGRLAPTAKNSQVQRIHVAMSENALSLIDSVTPCRYGAPVCLVVCYDSKGVFTYPGGGKDSGDEDASIVATFMMLAAAARGIGSCWVNYFDPGKIRAALSLPENEEPVLILDIGYPSPEWKGSPNHAKRKALEETVTFL